MKVEMFSQSGASKCGTDGKSPVAGVTPVMHQIEPNSPDDRSAIFTTFDPLLLFARKGTE